MPKKLEEKRAGKALKKLFYLLPYLFPIFIFFYYDFFLLFKYDFQAMQRQLNFFDIKDPMTVGVTRCYINNNRETIATDVEEWLARSSEDEVFT